MKKGTIEMTYGTGRTCWLIRPVSEDDSLVNNASTIMIDWEENGRYLSMDEIGLLVEYKERLIKVGNSVFNVATIKDFDSIIKERRDNKLIKDGKK